MDCNFKIKAMQWNAQGTTNFTTIKQIEQLLSQEDIDILCLAETFLKSHHKFYLNGYRVYRNDRENGHGGGVAIVIKNSIKHKLLPICKTALIENISVAIFINGKERVFTSAYCPKYFKYFRSDIKKLTKGNKEFFVFVDFNAKNTAWNCEQNNTMGNILYDLQLKSNFFIYNSDTATHFPHSGNTPSNLNIYILNSPLHISEITSLHDQLNFDHCPITCFINAHNIDRTEKRTFNFKHAN